MKAVRFSRFGDPEVLEIVEVPTPRAGLGEVLVRTGVAGVNFFEVLMRADRYAMTPELPMMPGVEVAGVVEALGVGVSGIEVGTRVAVPMFAVGRPSGGYAEYLAIDAASVVPLPDELSFEDAVALMVQGLTALHLVRQAPPEGKSILVTAAGGGVGSLLLQLAKGAGAKRIIAAASSEEKLGLARSLGADFAVNYDGNEWLNSIRDATNGRGIDIVYDLVGGSATRSYLGTLAEGGELVFTALGRFDLGPADMERMLAANQCVRGFSLLPLLSPDRLKDDLASLFDRVVRGELRVTLGGRYRLDQAAEAHRALERRSSTGKVVLIP